MSIDIKFRLNTKLLLCPLMVCSCLSLTGCTSLTIPRPDDAVVLFLEDVYTHSSQVFVDTQKWPCSATDIPQFTDIPHVSENVWTVGNRYFLVSVNCHYKLDYPEIPHITLTRVAAASGKPMMFFEEAYALPFNGNIQVGRGFTEPVMGCVLIALFLAVYLTPIVGVWILRRYPARDVVPDE